jgi:hypothetical protein
LKKWQSILVICLFVLTFTIPANTQAGVTDLKTNLSSGNISGTEDVSKIGNHRNFLTEQEKKDLKKLGYDEKTWGRFIDVFDTGFDIYNDTPVFENFSGKIISRGGTCLGMCWLIVYYYENINFEEGGSTDVKEILAAIAHVGKLTIHGFKNFREFSKKDVEKMKKVMEITHLENFAPETMIQSIPGSQGLLPAGGERNALLNNLEIGKLANIAFFHRKPIKIGGVTIFNKPENGHALFTYKAIRFGSNVLFYMYDPNVIYENGNHSDYTLLYRGSNSKFELFPASYESWYHDMYPDGPTVVSTNSMINLIKEQLVRKAADVLKGIVSAARDFVSNAADAIQDATTQTWNTVTDVASTVGGGIKDTWNGVTGWIGSKLPSFSW